MIFRHLYLSWGRDFKYTSGRWQGPELRNGEALDVREILELEPAAYGEWLDGGPTLRKGKIPGFLCGCSAGWWGWRKRNRIVDEMMSSTSNMLNVRGWDTQEKRDVQSTLGHVGQADRINQQGDGHP